MLYMYAYTYMRICQCVTSPYMIRINLRTNSPNSRNDIKQEIVLKLDGMRE